MEYSVIGASSLSYKRDEVNCGVLGASGASSVEMRGVTSGAGHYDEGASHKDAWTRRWWAVRA